MNEHDQHPPQDDPGAEPQPLDPDIEQAITDNRKLLAIKLLRDRNPGVDLRTAKSLIEQRMIERGIEPKSNCFIATAAFGSDLAPEVQLLRNYRDTTLRTHRFGRLFIRLYEHTSPPIANLIRRSPTARCVTRTVIRAATRSARDSNKSAP